MSFDFTRYLSERLGTTESDTNLILGDWLRKYEPVSTGTHEKPNKAVAAGVVQPTP